MEIGKRDVYSAAAARHERADVRFGYVAVDFLTTQLLGKLARRVCVMCAAGEINALPQIQHTLGNTRNAFRQMSQSRHVGKIVVMRKHHPAMAGGLCRQTLITGGMGAIGSHMADWLAESRMTRSVVMVGRTGRRSGGGGRLRLLHEWTGSISLLRGDSSASAEAAASVDGMRAVQSIVHAAGVLADAMLPNQTASRVRTSMAPKVGGMENAIQRMHLNGDASFLCFSSITAFLGSPGQANYGASNRSLDAACALLKASGRVGLSVQWGAWNDAAGGGMAGGDAAAHASDGRGCTHATTGACGSWECCDGRWRTI